MVHGAVSSSDGIGALVGVAVAVGQHDDPCAVLDRLVDLPADVVQPRPQGRFVVGAGDVEQAADRHRGEARHVAVVVDPDDLGQLVVVEHRMRQWI